MKKKITIRDIARVANVSIGTVDRVIHKRGKVSESALKKVNDAIMDLDYKPNPLARSLKNNVVYTISIYIPNPENDLYWLPCKQGILEIIAEYEAFDLDISVHYYNPLKPDSFLIKGSKLIAKSPDAFLFVPLFERESDVLLKKLRENGILTATFNSMPSNHVDQHVGQDLFLSGRVGAKLISNFIKSSSKIGIVHMDEAFGNAIHMQQKEEGFRSFFKNYHTKYDIHTKTLNSRDVGSVLLDFIRKYDIDTFFVTNSKTYEIVRTLDLLGKKGIIVGYDLLPENTKHLVEGRIQFLIHQAPRQQASLSLKSLVENLLFKKEFPKKQLLPIEIINSENLESYL
ncbi:MAG: LacI family DNA-binding transcriptional regulator [Bacteroidota bacterium]|nr:LacI family DNA-binding transcriptional regulator [Bacteroidota bacterium]